MIDVLLIGCGNIGALYDLDNEQVLTYAKAFSLDPDLKVTVYDQNPDVQEKIAVKYGFNTANDLFSLRFSDFALVCIATPTVSHFDYLQKAILEKVPVICCEKPVTYHPEEVTQLRSLYEQGQSRILVNYIRRFQEGYQQLQQEVTTLLNQGETLQHIRINYKRGLMNNGSHLLDIIQLLTGCNIQTEKHLVTASDFDVFQQDPTLSGILKQDTFDLELIGHAYADYPVFDGVIELSEHQIHITDAGDVWNIYANKDLSQPVLSRTGVIHNYMLSVREWLKKMLEDQTINDNFTESLELNNRLLQLIMHQNHG